MIGDVDHHAAGSVRAEGIGTERGGEISDEFEFSAVKELRDDDPRELDACHLHTGGGIVTANKQKIRSP